MGFWGLLKGYKDASVPRTAQEAAAHPANLAPPFWIAYCRYPDDKDWTLPKDTPNQQRTLFQRNIQEALDTSNQVPQKFCLNKWLLQYQTRAPLSALTFLLDLVLGGWKV